MSAELRSIVCRAAGSLGQGMLVIQSLRLILLRREIRFLSSRHTERVGDMRDAKVGYLDNASFIDKEVCWFDVAVDDPLVMHWKIIPLAQRQQRKEEYHAQ